MQIWYVFQVISTVVMVASTRIRTIAAANAQMHPDSQRAQLHRLVKALRVTRAFKSAVAPKLRRVSVSEVRQTLQRRATIEISKAPPKKSIMKNWWCRITSLACFRGFSSYLIMAVSQWYLAVAIDFFLSGQPSELRLGYGSTSIVLATIWGSGFAVWTHYCITKPSNKRIYNHFPKGEAVLIELWPITASWAIAEQLSMSGPLALSRWFELKKYAFDMDSWNTLDERGQQRKILEFAIVFLLYLALVAFISLPATMILRRVHASMLSDEDLAIVPFNRGISKTQPYDDRSKIRRPGLTVSQAWQTITWQAYFNVLLVYIQYFAMNQFIQMAYWSTNWKLHEVFQVGKYMETNLPCSPVGRVLPFSTRNITGKGIASWVEHSEL